MTLEFSYDNTRSKGIGWLCIGGSLGAAFSYQNYWLAASLFLLGIALDSRIKREDTPCDPS